MMTLIRTLLVLVTALSTSGCDTNVPPAIPGGEAFTVWGQLDPTMSRQALRVVPITATIDEAPDFSSVSVTSVDLDTGVETVWRDSVLTLSADTPAHVFIADIQPDFGSRLEVRVSRDGEVASYARFTVPSRVLPYFDPLVTADRDYIDLVSIGAPRVVGGFVDYTVHPPGRPENVTVERFRVRDALHRSIDTGWRTRVDFTDHVPFLVLTLDERYEETVRTVAVCEIRLTVSIANVEWAAPFPLPFSEVLLIQPGTVSNVRNGFGFVGGAYTVSYVWEATPNQLQRIGLVPPDNAGCEAATL